jgi:hypothetical protein
MVIKDLESWLVDRISMHTHTIDDAIVEFGIEFLYTQEWEVGRHEWGLSDTGVAPKGRELKMHSGEKKQIAVGMHAYFKEAN